MQLTDIQDNSREQNVFKRKRTQATPRRESAIIMIFQNTSHRNVRNKENHKASLLSNKNSEVQSDEC